MNAQRRLLLLQSLTARLAAAQSAQEVAAIIMQEGLPGLQADVGVVAVLEADGKTLRNIGFEGVGARTRDEWASYPVDSPVPVAEAALKGQLVLVRSRAERNDRYPVLAAVHGPDNGGPVIALPLKVEGRLHGVLGLCFPEERPFPPEDVEFLQALADQTAIALERARLALESREALARLRLASDAGGFGIYERDLSRDMPVWENDRMYEIFGRSRAAGPIGNAEFRSRIVHPDDMPVYEAAIARARSAGGAVEFECRIRRMDEYRWLRLAGRVDRSGGPPGRLVGVMRDVTAEKAAIAALTETAASLRQSQDALALAMRAGRMGAWSRDLVTDRVWWSRELEEIFGLEPGGFAGTKDGFRGLIHDDDRAAFGEAVEKAIRTRAEYAAEFRFRHASGEWRWMDGRGGATYDADGRPVALHGVGIDITERKRIEEALRDEDRRKDEFLATLAHELRNPLAPISNAVHIMRSADMPADALHVARDVIGRQVEQMVRLIDDLMDVSRISRGKLALRMEPVSLSEVLNRALETSMPHMAGHDLTVSLPDEALPVRADTVRLAQVFSNLLNNAAKFTEKGGRISLTAARARGAAEVRVADSGIGIAQEHLPRLFRMFSQAQPALQRTHGGLGIGLALSRGLVEMHGGTIEARSAGLGRGSEFVVTLPLVSTARASTPAHKAVHAYLRSSHRVLIVDDVRDSAESLATLLRLSGSEVRLAHDGKEAVEVAMQWRPEVVLLDIGLPKLNGFDVCRQLRAQSWGREIAVVALTGWGQDEDRRKSAEAGFDAHLVKPVSLAALGDFLASIRPTRAH